MAYNRLSKHHIIAQELRGKILAGCYVPNQSLQSENELCAEFEASRATVRKAIDALVKEGLIYTLPGKGSFVSKPEMNRYQVRLNSEEAPLQGRLMGVQIVTPDPELALKTQIIPGGKLLMICRLFYKENTLVGFGKKYIPYAANKPLLEMDFQYTSFEARMDIQQRKRVQIKACASDAEIAQKLSVKEGTPVFQLQQAVTDDAGGLQSYEIMYMLGQHYTVRGE